MIEFVIGLFGIVACFLLLVGGMMYLIKKWG
jgi:hypothetical protein